METFLPVIERLQELHPKLGSMSFLCLFLTFGFTSCIQNTDSKDRPNFVIFIADDMNWNDSGAYGHPFIRTPNIDKLAEQGMLFTNAFLTTSSCSPSRTSILTGKYPHNTDAEQLHWPLPEGQTTFMQILKAAGYWTGLAGKYHLGDAVRSHFSKVMEVGTAGFQVGPDGKPQEQTDNGSGCQSWLDLVQSAPKDQPFCLWLAAVDPHRPYADSIISNPHNAEDVLVPPYLPDNASVREDFASYYDEISRLDSYIGETLLEMDRMGLRENTVVLFISDNGRPFPRDKTTLYDGGIKTPWIIRWPDHIAVGSRNDNMVSSIDIAPTLLDLARLDIPGEFEGVVLSPTFADTQQSIRSEIYAEDHWHDFEDYTRAIRTAEFKYIKNYFTDLPNTPPADAFRGLTYQSMLELKSDNKLNEAQLRCFELPRPEEELYDMVNDPNELVNLAENPAYQDQLNSMRGKLKEYRTKTSDYLPKNRTPDDFDRQTGLPTEHRIRPRPSKAEMMKAK